jgi:hypothetical protein
MVSDDEQVTVLQPGQRVHLEIREQAQWESSRQPLLEGGNREPDTTCHGRQRTKTDHGMARASKKIAARRGFLAERRRIRGFRLIGLRGWRFYFPFRNRGLAQDGINIEAVEWCVNQEGPGKVRGPFSREDVRVAPEGCSRERGRQ